jgi:hypothetical protein
MGFGWGVGSSLARWMVSRAFSTCAAAPLFFYSFIIFFLLSPPCAVAARRVLCFRGRAGGGGLWAGVVLKSVFIYGGRA